MPPNNICKLQPPDLVVVPQLNLPFILQRGSLKMPRAGGCSYPRYDGITLQYSMLAHTTGSGRGNAGMKWRIKGRLWSCCARILVFS
jgi:hypothetical protein